MNKALLFITAFATSSFLASAEVCLSDWSFEVQGCNYQELLERLNDELAGTDCSHNAATELRTALGVDSEEEAISRMEEECAKGYFPWDQVSKKGLVFDKEVMDGGTYYNEERESLDEYGNYQHRLAEDPGARINEIYDNIAQDEGIEFPDYLTNFENCELRAVMCCFVQDRQANDNNGNCETPYDEQCVDADPADNTDICYHDYANSPTASRTPGGFSIFNGDEGDSHCHGFAWANDVLDGTARLRGNSLFYVTLYDHLVQRGYVGNIPGAPKCACIEQMPVVTRADCTQTDTTNEKVEFSFNDEDGVNATIASFDIDFNACQGANNNNNDLEAYYEQLKNDGKATEAELEEVREHLVGSDNCKIATANFLESKGLRRKIPTSIGQALST
jgi:hypothetical protein